MNTIKLALLNSALILGLSLNASAASALWTGTAGTGIWNQNGNWSPNNTFPGTSGTTDNGTFSSAATLTGLGANLSIGSIILNNAAATVSITDSATHTLTLGSTAGTGAINVSAGSLTLDASTAFSGSAVSQFINVASGSNVTFGGSSAVTLAAGASFIHFTGSGTTTFGSNLTISSTSARLFVDSGATLNLTAAPTFSGSFSGSSRNLNLNGGTLLIGAVVGASIADGTNGSTLLLSANGAKETGIIQITGAGAASTATYTIGMNVGTTATGSYTGGVSLNQAGVSTGTTVVNLTSAANNNVTFAGLSSPGAGTLQIFKVGTGTVTLSGANTFNGTTTVSQGTLSLTNFTSGVDEALQDTVLATGGGGIITLGGISGTGTATGLMFGGLSGSQALASQITSGYTGSITNVTLNTQTGGSPTYSGVIANGAAAGTSLTVTGTGTQTLSGASSFSGGTTVTGTATLILANGSGTGTTTAANNLNGSATGSGTLTVGAGATLGGTGTSAGSKFILSGVTGTKTLVLVGQTSTSDTNTTGALTLLGGTGAGNSTIANANLTFNLDTTSVGSGNKLNVGATGIDFSSGGVVLTLNMQNTGIIPANSAYVLIAGTGTTTMTLSSTPTATSGQFGGLQTFVNAQGLNQILNSGDGQGGNLALALTGLSETYYGPGSYLFINNSGGVDDIEVEFVPEPGTWALMLGGLAMLVWIQRKRAARSMQS